MAKGKGKRPTKLDRLHKLLLPIKQRYAAQALKACHASGLNLTDPYERLSYIYFACEIGLEVMGAELDWRFQHEKRKR